MAKICDELCFVLCSGFSNGTLIALWPCLTILCRVRLEINQRSDFLGYLTKLSVEPKFRHEFMCTDKEVVKYALAKRYTVAINGYIAPPIILLTIVSNTLVCIVLLKKHMRSSTNALFVALAMSEMFTGLCQFPVSVYFNASKRVHELIPYNWCYAHFLLQDHMPVIFHTASIWLTIALAAQRYICVCHPVKSRTWCTMRNAIFSIITIYFCATIIQAPKLFEFSLTEIWRRSQLKPAFLVSACVIMLRPWFLDNFIAYFNIYYWSRIIFINLIPCLALVVLNTILIYTMRKAMKKRIELLRQNITCVSQRMKETNFTTMMLSTVVVIFLLVEFPLTVLLNLKVVSNTSGIFMFSNDTWQKMALFFNLFILLSYPLNIFIYCGMSKQFREQFKHLFRGAARHKKRDNPQ